MNKNKIYFLQVLSILHILTMSLGYKVSEKIFTSDLRRCVFNAKKGEVQESGEKDSGRCY